MKLKALEWKKWKDWERALVAWKERGHDGLSLAGLAEVTGRSPAVIEREIRRRGTAGGCHCMALNAPVFIIRYVTLYDEKNLYRVKWGHRKFYVEQNYGVSKPEKFWEEVSEVRGPETWKVRPSRVLELKRIARGEKSPWRRKVKGDYSG